MDIIQEQLLGMTMSMDGDRKGPIKFESKDNPPKLGNVATNAAIKIRIYNKPRNSRQPNTTKQYLQMRHILARSIKCEGELEIGRLFQTDKDRYMDKMHGISRTDAMLEHRKDTQRAQTSIVSTSVYPCNSDRSTKTKNEIQHSPTHDDQSQAGIASSVRR